MNRVLRTLAGGLVGLGALGLAGCDFETNPAGLQILGNVVPDDSCTVQAQGGGQQAFRFQGVLDVAVGTNYTGYLFLQNGFPQFSTLSGFEPEDGRLEPGTVTLDTAQVTLTFPGLSIVNDLGTFAPELAAQGITLSASGQNFVASYSLPVQATVPVNGAGAAGVSIIPSTVGQLMRGLTALAVDRQSIVVTAEVVLAGVRADLGAIKSSTFKYPITVCNGCLRIDAFPPNVAADPLNNELTVQNFPCELGADVDYFNSICGFFYGPNAANNTCALDRCLGRVFNDAPPSEGGALPEMICPFDDVGFLAP